MEKSEFKERLAELRKDAVDKFSEYLKAENELVFEAKFSQSGFIDQQFIDRLNRARDEWQTAANQHTDFVKYGDRSGLF